MPWAKGQSGNPKGRKPGSTATQKLREAIAKVEKDKNLDYLETAVLKSLEDARLMTAILKKLVPDRKATELTHKVDPLEALTDEQLRLRVLRLIAGPMATQDDNQ